MNVLESSLRTCGIRPVDTLSKPGRDSAIIVFNDRPSVRLRLMMSSIPVTRRVLIVMEPEATSPTNFDARILTQYGHAFYASPLWAAKMSGESFPWPQDIAGRWAPHSEQTSYLFDSTMVMANKRSASTQSLYRLRREVLRSASTESVNLALFGPNWNRSALRDLTAGGRALAKCLRAGVSMSFAEAFSDVGYVPTCWMGVVNEKRAALQFALSTIAIENSLDFVSEKLFDPLLSGTVPIYVGPNLEKFGIPRTVALQVPPDRRHILDMVKFTSPSRLEEVRIAGSEWIRSESAMAFDESRVMANLGRRIAEKLLR